MRTLQLAMLGCLLPGLLACGGTFTTSTTSSTSSSGGTTVANYKDKIVGLWETANGNGAVEFTKEGKRKTGHFTPDGSKAELNDAGTYSVDGDILTFTPGGKAKITSLTDTELRYESDDNGMKKKEWYVRKK
jgi:hypothetical protein